VSRKFWACYFGATSPPSSEIGGIGTPKHFHRSHSTAYTAEFQQAIGMSSKTMKTTATGKTTGMSRTRTTRFRMIKFSVTG
jgi:hypothetical protein